LVRGKIMTPLERNRLEIEAERNLWRLCMPDLQNDSLPVNLGIGQAAT
jgi:hypothetical protein